MLCAIWGTGVVEEKPRTGDVRIMNSPRAGGWYEIDGSTEAVAAQLNQNERLAITRWLVAQRAAGDPIPRLDSNRLASAELTRKRTFTERVNAFLVKASRDLESLNMSFRIVRNSTDPGTLSLMAQTDSRHLNDLMALSLIIKQMGLLAEKGAAVPEYVKYGLTAQAWERVETLEHLSPSGDQAFVAMWFDPLMDDAFANGFAPAIERAGYRPMRIDGKDHVNKVDDEIVAEIRRSRFLIADFTCAPKSVRGGVYFEAGFAMGLSLPVIWTAKSTSIDDLHFDTRQYNHIVWDTPTDLSKKLEQRIRAVLGAGPLAAS